MDVIFNFQFFVEQAASCKTVSDSMDQGVNKPTQSKPTNVCSQVLQHLVPTSQAQALLQQQLSLAAKMATRWQQEGTPSTHFILVLASWLMQKVVKMVVIQVE